MFLAIKEIKKEKARFFMIVSVIMLISYLVYFLSSLAFGLAQINRTAVDYWNSEGIIISSSANGNLYASVIEEDVATDLQFDEKDLINITNGNIYSNKDADTLQSVVFIGAQSESSVYPPLEEGRFIEDEFEVVISDNIKNDLDLKLNDKITLAQTKREFEVVGFTKDSNFNTSPVVYAQREMVSQAMMQYDTSITENDTQSSPTINMPNRVSAIVVDKSFDIESLNLEKEELQYLTTEDFIKKLPGYQAQVLTFGLMIVSLSLIVSVIMGIFMYILTMQKKSVFAVLKIQGYQNSYIVQSIFIQVLLLLVVGVLIGFSLTYLTLYFLPSSVPVALNWMLITIVTFFITVTSLLGAIFSARAVLKIDPLNAL